MIYPVPYFRLRHWLRPPSLSTVAPRLPFSRYQYGRATRGTAFMRLPPKANFSGAPPFDFFALVDNLGVRVTFEFRPAGGAPSVAGHVPIDLTTAVTGIDVADRTQSAINGEAAVGPQITPFLTGRLGILSQVNTTVGQEDELSLAMLRAGPCPNCAIDTTGIVGVAGFVARGFLTGHGGIIVGKTVATGYIAPASAAQITAGELVRIPDGLITREFVFVEGGLPVVAAPQVAVPIDGMSAAQVAVQLASIINSAAAPPAGPGAFLVTAVPEPGDLIRLTNDVAGARGGGIFFPQYLSDTVVNAAFAVWGMMGGQDGSILTPLRWGLSRGAAPIDLGWELIPGGG